jgi:DNA-binding protein YbaB
MSPEKVEKQVPAKFIEATHSQQSKGGVVVITMSTNKNPKSLTVQTPSSSGSRIPISPVASDVS